MEELTIWFGYAVKIFIVLGVGLLLVCIGTGLTFIYQVFKVTLYSMSLAHKYNRFRAMKSEVQDIALKTELFKELNIDNEQESNGKNKNPQRKT